MLSKKSLTELRGIAQSLGIKDIFKLDRAHLMQQIDMKQAPLAPVIQEKVVFPYDSRLMTKPPSKLGDQAAIEELLAPYVARGLRVSFTDEQWKMSVGMKSDQGTLRMPLRHVLRCAERLLEP